MSARLSRARGGKRRAVLAAALIGALAAGPLLAQDVVDLEVSLRRIAPEGPLPPGSSASLTYLVEVINHGPGDAPEVALEVIATEGLTQLDWDCAVPDASCTPSLGSGPVEITAPLPAGTRATLTLFGQVAAVARFVTLDAVLPARPGPIRIHPDNDALRLVDPLRVDAVFRGGFEAGLARPAG